MEQLRPIFWEQGMLLQPQHFQRQDCYHETRLRRYLSWLQPFCWGLKSLSVNQAALQQGELRVDQCELATPDGTIICCHDDKARSNARILPRALRQILADRVAFPAGGVLEVYLGLQRLQEGRDNVYARHETLGGSTTGAEQRRFCVEEEEEVADFFFAQNGRRRSLKSLRYEVRPVLGPNEVKQAREHACEVVKIAELRRIGDGQGVMLSEDYIPPALSIAASATLMSMLQEMQGLLLEKGHELTSYKSRRHIHAVGIGSRQAVYLLVMQLINKYIQRFHHYLDEVPQTHPCVLYALLRDLVGECSTFSETSILDHSLPTYDHNQLWECFHTTIHMAKQLLNEATTGPQREMPFTHDGRYFIADLEGELVPTDHYYLSIETDESPESIKHLFDTATIASHQEIEHVERFRYSSVKTRYLENPPEELLGRTGCRHFEIVYDRNSKEIWDEIHTSRRMAIACGLPAKTAMYLLIIRRT